MRGAVLVSALLLAGCATTRRCAPECVPPPLTCFERVGQFDFRENAPGGPNSLDDFRRAVQPGDLVVTYMNFKRALWRRQWIFTVLPCGHSMMVLDPGDPKGLLECRFHGAQRVGPEELLQYTNCQVYRLRDRRGLDLARLNEFADYACKHVKGYDPKGWVGINPEMAPETLDQIAPKYTCSNFIAAAYHYAGVSLSAGAQTDKVITPNSLAASVGAPREVRAGTTIGPEAGALRGLDLPGR